jgi:hemolysin III
MLATEPASSPKPVLRGVSHELAACGALFACVALARVAPTTRALVAALTYGLSLVALFGASALYHRPTWSVRPRRIMKRVDHSAIFLLIAGTYTPLCLLLGRREGSVLLAVVWGGALLGIVRCVLWVDAPNWLRAAIYLLLGWVILPVLPDIRAAVGSSGLLLLASGGVAYSVGAVVYATRWPDPSPRVFGYHEVFHALVVAAAACHFAVVLQVVRALR